jgi:DNA-binding MarR family transcriptional regulator
VQLTERVLRTDQSPDDKILGVLERLGQAHRSFLQDLATRNGLTPLQVQVVTALGEGPPPLPYVGDIARELGITQPSASDAVAALEAKGYVSRVVDSNDRRRVALALTERGVALDEQLVRDRSVLRSALGPLSTDERETVLVALQRVMTLFSEAAVLPNARNCPTCRYLGTEADGGYRCNYLRQQMAVGDLRVNCFDHSPRR